MSEPLPTLRTPLEVRLLADVEELREELEGAEEARLEAFCQGRIVGGLQDGFGQRFKTENHAFWWRLRERTDRVYETPVARWVMYPGGPADLAQMVGAVCGQGRDHVDLTGFDFGYYGF